MDRGSKKVGAFKTFDNIESDGDARTEDERLEEFFKYVRRKSREFDMAIRTECKEVQQPSNRRKQPIQRPVDEEIQSAKKAFKKLQSTYYPYWYANPPRDE